MGDENEGTLNQTDHKLSQRICWLPKNTFKRTGRVQRFHYFWNLVWNRIFRTCSSFIQHLLPCITRSNMHNLKLILSGNINILTQMYTVHVNHGHLITKLNHLVLPAAKVAEASLNHDFHSSNCQKLINVNFSHYFSLCSRWGMCWSLSYRDYIVTSGFSNYLNNSKQFFQIRSACPY